MAILSALLLAVLMGLGALAVDLSLLFAARGELQDAADATALAGAACLIPRIECGNMSKPAPDWSTADQLASSFVSRNEVLNTPLSTASVANGYWNVKGSPPGLQPTSNKAGANDMPAIQVTVRRRDGENGGSIAAVLAEMLGVTSSALSAKATAAITSPGTANPGALFPVAIAQCMYDAYWDSSTGTPKLATAVQVPGFDLPQTIGQPYVFKMTSSYKAGTCQSGEWSSLDMDANSVSTIKQLMVTGNTTPISIGDDVWIQPGSKTSLYKPINECSAAGDHSCEYVTLPVVTILTAHVYTPMVGLACVRLLSAVGGSSSYIVGQMSADTSRCKARNTGGVGPNYGLLQPPRLVQ